MPFADSAASEEKNYPRTAILWAAPVCLLVALWLWLAFSSGGYIARHWLVPNLALGLFGLVVSTLTAYPRRPRQLSLVVLALFGGYSIWVASSAIWADSTMRVWMESGRTFSYLLVFALALVYLTDSAARKALRYLLLLAALVILALCTWKLWSSGAIALLFSENRFYYPVSYPNNAAALFLITFWPLMWLAAGPEERAPVRGIALGVATGLLGLTILTQSRGAFWSLAFSLVIMFVLSPARMRTLVYLLVPALLMVYEFPTLNRYWLEGPTALGGAPGARTIVLASVVAGSIGMILALLERWVKIAGRAKLVVNTIVGVVVAGCLVYGSIALTSDAGGPLKWASQTWRQFTGQTASPSEQSSDSRLLVVSDSGRVELWKVAWEAFERSPVLGIGADNFIFQNDRFRANPRRQAQQAHSIELQVLGETGIVGGVFAFEGIFLGLLGVLWPRWVAGWRGARVTWFRRRNRLDSSETQALQQEGRWGSDPRAYGWEMALIAGAAYWFIHASVDWLWQMPGVTIPAVLFLAAAVSSVDGRAGLLWPRVNRWLRIGSRSALPSLAPPPGGVEMAESQSSSQPEHAQQAPQADSFLTITRRSEQYAGKIERRNRREARRQRSAERLQPQGVLSHVFRALLVTLSLLVLIVAGLPYLSLQLQNSAKALATTDGARAVQRAESAHWLLPSDPQPYVTQASVYQGYALRAVESGDSDRAGAVLDNLALAVASYERAAEVEPADWTTHYRVGAAALNLLLAKQYLAGVDVNLDYAELTPAVPGLADWSALAGVLGPLPSPGAAAGSLARDKTTQDIAASYRSLSREDLLGMSLSSLGAAEERNPLASQVDEAMRIVNELEGLE